MPNQNTTGGSPTGKAGEFGHDVERRVADAGNVVSETASTAAQRIDEGRSATAAQLDSVAARVQERAGDLPGGERVREFARAAADRLSTTADYVREHDISRMRGDVETLVKNNPGPALLIAAACGFLLGRALIRD